MSTIERYSPIQWESGTPLSASNLNHMDQAILTNREAVRMLDDMTAGLDAEVIEDIKKAPEYARIAKESAESAEAIVGIGIATTTKAGIVKPDGTTITVGTDGKISCVNGGGSTDSSMSDTSENAVQNKVIKRYIDDRVQVPIIEQGGVAGYELNGVFIPFVDAPAFELLGSASLSSTTKKTVNLTENISKYKYLLFGGGTFVDDIGTEPTSLTQSTNVIIGVDRLKASPFVTYYGSGSSGSITMLRCTVTYVDDYTITLQNTGSQARTWYMYGIK